MSGGQKQRICLARALYSNSDIYIIDDALSALDAMVSSKIMKNMILEELIKKHKKTVILVTHKLEFLNFSDRVLLIGENTILQNEKYELVRNTQDYRRFSEILKE